MSLMTAVDAAPQGSPSSGGEPLNSMCPVTTDEPVDPEIFTDHDGQRIAFCCQRCKRQFEREPQAYLASLRTVVSAASSATPESDDSHDSPTANANGHAHSDEGNGHQHGADATGAQPETDAHDHSAHDDRSSAGLSRILGWFGNFHPATVHFPIGLLMAGALAELLLLLTHNDFFAGPARFCVALGAAGAVGAAVLGWLFGGFHLSDQDWLMTTHRWIGTATAAWSIVVLSLSEARQRHPQPAWALRYRLSLFLGAALVSVAGFLGGSLVYGLDHYAW